MKLLITAFLLLLLNCANATDYFVDFTLGNDGNTGLSPAQAWKTIAKVNGFAFIGTNNRVVLKNGETWAGETIVPQKSGVAATPFIYGTYGAGAKATVTGMVTISSWTSLGSNRYKASVSGSPSKLNMVTIAGRAVPMGRWPNFDSANAGYRTYSSFVQNTSITDSRTVYGSWIGADLLIRVNDFTTQRVTITGQAGNTFSFSATTSNNGGLHNNYGFFIENSLATLDQNGEWYYNPATGEITMYYNTTPPTIQVTTTPTLVNMVYGSSGAAKSYIQFRGISFVGSDSVMVAATWANFITFDSCDFQYAGVNAFDLRYTPYFTLTNSNIKDINDIGIFTFSNFTLTHHTSIIGNNFDRIGINAGMQTKNTFYDVKIHLSGIVTGAGDLIIRNNTFDSIGYSHVSLLGNNTNQLIKNNIMTNFCMRKNDGGAIYNAGIRGGLSQTNAFPLVAGLEISGNFISLNGDARPGTASVNIHARAIYGDATTAGLQIFDNTIYSAFTGIYLSQAQYNFVRGNTIFDCGDTTFTGSIELADRFGAYSHLTNNRITNNVFFAKKSVQQMWYFNDIFYGADSLGIQDSNYYINTAIQTSLLNVNNDISRIGYTLPNWKTLHAPESYDVHSFSTPMTTPVLTNANWFNYVRLVPNPTDTVRIYYFQDSIFMEPDGKRDTSFVAVQGWRSKALIYVGKINGLPVVDAGADKAITLPTTTTSVTGTVTDDGTFTVLWSQLSGPATATFGTATSVTTSVNSLTVAGTYTLKLTATDNLGAVSSDFMQIVVSPAVTPPNTPPTVNAGSDVIITLPTTTTSFTAIGSDPGGSIASYAWTFLSGPIVPSITSASTATTGITGLTLSGDYFFLVTVTDNLGATGTDAIKVTVNPAPTTPPIPDAGADVSFPLPTTAVTLAGSGTDGLNCAIGTNHTWTLISNPAGSFPIITTPSSYTSTFTNMLIPGDYVLRLTVVGACGSTVSDDITIHLQPVYIPPSGCNCFPTFTKFEN